MQAARQTITTSLLSKHFAGFNTCGDPILEKMLLAAHDWIGEVQAEKQPRWLSLTGESGTGKTFLAQMALAACRTIPKLMEHRALSCPVLKTYWPTLLNQLRDGHYYRVTDLIAANVVLLDELAIEHDPSGFGADKLCHILSGRVGKWTIITSNLAISRIASLDNRIASRMNRCGSVVINCNTQDYAMRGS